jgi:hypothetical protein
VELREREGSDKQLDESAFMDWYVCMIFATDETRTWTRRKSRARARARAV